MGNSRTQGEVQSFAIEMTEKESIVENNVNAVLQHFSEQKKASGEANFLDNAYQSLNVRQDQRDGSSVPDKVKKTQAQFLVNLALHSSEENRDSLLKAMSASERIKETLSSLRSPSSGLGDRSPFEAVFEQCSLEQLKKLEACSKKLGDEENILHGPFEGFLLKKYVNLRSALGVGGSRWWYSSKTPLPNRTRPLYDSGSHDSKEQAWKTALARLDTVFEPSYQKMLDPNSDKSFGNRTADQSSPGSESPKVDALKALLQAAEIKRDTRRAVTHLMAVQNFVRRYVTEVQQFPTLILDNMKKIQSFMSNFVTGQKQGSSFLNGTKANVCAQSSSPNSGECHGQSDLLATTPRDTQTAKYLVKNGIFSKAQAQECLSPRRDIGATGTTRRNKVSSEVVVLGGRG